MHLGEELYRAEVEGIIVEHAFDPSSRPFELAQRERLLRGPKILQVLGTGGAVSPGRGVSVLTGIMPNVQVAPNAVITNGAETPGFAGSWNVQSWAICTAPVAGHTVVVTVGVATSASPKTLTSTCPAGRPVHGVGFLTVGAGVGEIFLNAAYPNPPLPVGTSVPVTASEDQGGVAGNWAIRTFAICAT